jgi:hypothetical protein
MREGGSVSVCIIHQAVDSRMGKRRNSIQDSRTISLTQEMATVVPVPQPLHRLMLGVIHELADPARGQTLYRRPDHTVNSGNGDSGSHATTAALVDARYNP